LGDIILLLLFNWGFCCWN